MTENELRQKACACARSWLGRREADGSFRPIIDTYNQIRPHPGYRMTYTDPWCAAFVSAVGWAVGLSGIIFPECSCDRMITLYQRHGRWCEDDSYHAKPGDVIFYDWEDNGVGDNRGESDHVGLVVEDNGHYMTIIEGNHNDAVGKRTLAYNSQFIRGFGLPDYATMAEEGTPVGPDEPQEPEKPEEPTDDKKSDEIAYGDIGWSVQSCQGMLIAHGYSCGPDGADGEFGYNTRNAALRFQRDWSLPDTGTIDKATLSALLGVTI